MSVDISLSELTTAEKLQLMERLWVDDVPPPAWHGTVLDERCQAERQDMQQLRDHTAGKLKTTIVRVLAKPCRVAAKKAARTSCGRKPA